MSNLQVVTASDRTVFKAHKTSVGFWTCQIVLIDSEVNLEISHAKKLGGIYTPAYVPIHRKNIGRANETTALAQAASERDSRVAKQLKKGYRLTAPELGAEVTNGLGEKKPMLAMKYHDVKQSEIDWDNAYAQVKLDGHRGLRSASGKFYSRSGTEINLPHILQGIKDAGLDGIPLDGEIYCHGKTLQEIGSLIKRPREESKELRYHIYDVIGSVPWVARVNSLLQISDNDGITIVQYTKVHSHIELEFVRQKCVKEGYEGVMLKHGTLGYEDDTRSKNLLKLKEYQDAEFTIVGAKKGKPKRTKEGRKLEVCVYQCITEKGHMFACTAPGDMYEKDAAWEAASDVIGRELTVKFFNYSKNGVPQQPVALRLRQDI